MQLSFVASIFKDAFKVQVLKIIWTEPAECLLPYNTAETVALSLQFTGMNSKSGILSYNPLGLEVLYQTS